MPKEMPAAAMDKFRSDFGPCHQHLSGIGGDCSQRTDDRGAEKPKQHPIDRAIAESAKKKQKNGRAGGGSGGGRENDRRVQQQRSTVKPHKLTPQHRARVWIGPRQGIYRLVHPGGNPRQPGREYVEQRRKSGQQKDRGERHLNDAGDRIESDSKRV